MNTVKVKRKYRRLPKGPNGGIQLLLIHNVDALGRQGDLVEVRPGYANNYLLPQGLATIATAHHRRMVEKHKVKLLEIERSRLATLRQLADELARLSVNIEARANAEGILYGSVGSAEIIAAVKDNGYSLTADQIRLEGQLKELGLYEVLIHLHRDVETKMKVWVMPSAPADE